MMAVEKEFETETMAQIYADQGHYDKAAAIYRRLLIQAPEREDLRRRLKAVEERLESTASRTLSTQFSAFIDLLLKKKQIDKLRNLRKPR
jgi:Trp operon repressor